MGEDSGREDLDADAPWTDLAPFKSGQKRRHLADSQIASTPHRKSAAPLHSIFNRLRGKDGHEPLFRKGSDGDDGVGARLAKLESEGWRYVNSVPVGTQEAGVDHVAIGPGGVFALTSKNHVGKRVHVDGRGILVDGRPTPYLSDTLIDADEVGRLLSQAAAFPVFVTGVVVVVAHDLKHRARPEGVTVVSRRLLTAWLRGLPPRLTEDDIVILYDVARRSTTWQRPDPPPATPAPQPPPKTSPPNT